MRSYIACYCVRVVSLCLDHAYLANCEGDRCKEQVYVRVGRIAQKILFPIARVADKEMMTTEMIESGWFG